MESERLAFASSAEIAGLTKALAEAQKQFPEIARDLTAQVTSRRTGQTYSYAYTDLSTYLAAVRPILAAHGIALMQFPICQVASGEAAWIGITTVIALGNEWIANSVRLPVPASADPQSIGSLLTYARRYGLAALVAVAPRAEDDDAVSVSTGAVRQMPTDPEPEARAIEPTVTTTTADADRDGLYVEQVLQKPTSKPGVTRYEIVLSDGRRPTTIKETLARRAEGYMVEGTPVRVDVETTKYGLNLVAIDADQSREAVSDDDIPF